MKRISLILVLLSLFAGALFAQADMGITLGLNMANVSQKDITKNESRTGFNAGAFVQYKSGDNFIVEPQILFTKKGFNVDLPTDPFTSLSYVQIPIHLKYDLGVSVLKIQPFIGPNIS
ncbi:MAG: outer membrane beta-barrel protein [Candidatus Cloacimonetes bacterium]|nr:outer membrane beta-barrel protein [Candidatus Cloacimonadota bacterium]